ncbi:MAG: transglutaminase-like domain-containing protein [Lachnospiraceae bacterium]|nr:transglutaminase-like domain-containing protein [Lachnospiraceae bacterium]
MRNRICWETEKKHGRHGMRMQAGGGWFDSLLLFCGALVCLGSAYRQLDELLDGMQGLVLPEHTFVYVLLSAAGLSGYYGSGFFKRIWMRLLPLLPMAVCFGRYYRGHQLQIEDGILYLLRMYAVKISEYYEHSFLFPLGEEAEAPAALAFWVLLIFSGLFVLAAVCGQMEWILALPVAMLVAGLAVGKGPGWESMLFLFVSALIFRAYRVSFHQKPLARMGQLVGVTGICLLAGAVLSVLADDVVAKHDVMMERQLALEDAVLTLPVWNLFSQDGTVTNNAPLGNGREVLTMDLSEKPTENIYLKTYAADHYESGRWSISEDAFAQVAAAQGMTVQEAGARILNMPCEEGKEVLEPEDARAAVDYLAVAGPRQYAYTIHCRNFGKAAPLPYMSVLPEGFVADGDTSAEKPWTMREYSGTMALGGNIASPLTEYLNIYYVVNTWDLDEMLISSLSEARRKEQPDEMKWYSDYVEGLVIDHPGSEEVKKRLGEYLQIFGWKGLEEFQSYQTAAGEYGNIYFANGIRMGNVPMVQEILNDIGTYSRALDPLPAGTDPIDYFLNTSGEGYCVHFASAATLMLQAMGIPARYASGYVVFPKDFKRTEEGYTAVVTDARAHAWVEVYVEGFGWVPYEMTPGFRKGSEENEDRKENRDVSQNTQSTRDQAQPEHTPQTEQTPDGDVAKKTDTNLRGRVQAPISLMEWLSEMKLWGYPLIWWLQVLAAVAGVCVLIRLLIRLWRGYEEYQQRLICEEIRKGNYKEVINRINGRMYRLLSARERLIFRRIRDDRCYRRALCWLSALREAAVDVDLYMELVKQAHFSNTQMCEEDAWRVYEIYQRCRMRRREREKLANGYKRRMQAW